MYVVLYVVVVCVDNARPLFFAKSFYKLHHRRHTDTAASKLSTGSKQIINNNEFEKSKISGVALQHFGFYTVIQIENYATEIIEDLR